MITYLQIFEDMRQFFDAFDDAERGRLLSGMMAYAFDGAEPEFEGNERYIWPALRQHIDQCARRASSASRNGAQGGRPKAAESEEKPTKAKKSERKQTKANESQQEQEQEQEQEHEQDQEHTRLPLTGEAEGARAGEGYTEQERLLALAMRDTYNVSRSGQTMAALLEDLRRVGEMPLRAALKAAALKDTRGKVTANYYRTFLTGQNSRAAPPGRDYQCRRYTPEELEALAVDLERLEAEG